jgi:rhamnulokinase
MAMAGPLYIAVDLGAGSGRVFLAGVDPGEFLLEEIHRFQYPPTEENGHLRWDFAHIFDEIKIGLRDAGNHARELARPVQSLGIDSWAVDYGLLDTEGKLLANPVCYRDDRTKDAMERIFTEIPRSEIFEKTGIQFQTFNTLFQLFSESKDIGKASKLLLLPDLINYLLTGNAVAEYTNATTTQMVSAATRSWDLDLLCRLNIRAEILPEIVFAGSEIGNLRSEIADELNLEGVRVVVPSTHDTGSAIAGAPLTKNQAYVSSGTWSLIGIERNEALINAEVSRQNFTNEGGAYGTIRFLKNVMGLWIFESCRREWKASGKDVEYETILGNISERMDIEAFIFPDDERFLNPPSMTTAIEHQLGETGQEFNPDPTAMSKIIFDSLAFRYASVLQTIESLTSTKLESVQILGGGGRNRYLNQMTANASSLGVKAGLMEATVVGNVLVQAISSGRFESLSEARRHVADNFEFEEFEPQTSAELDEAATRYAVIESRFTV